jgi:hypothetical protein
MPAERTAMCSPSRNAQANTSAATIHCRAGKDSVENGHSAAPTPTSPTAKVQMVSTQPELPVRCWTIQATAISRQSPAAMAITAMTTERTIAARPQ